MLESYIGKKRLHLFRQYMGIIVAGLFISTAHHAIAQNSSASKKEEMKKQEEISLKDRFGFKTNAVDWTLTIPNIGVEFDLGNTIRNKRTVGANFKWNWNTSHKYVPGTVFNLFDAHVEWRQYFRTRQRGAVTKNPDFLTKLKETVFTTQREHPRKNRAYYWGVYANASSYNLKLGAKGRQGSAYGAGVSVGYTVPLYGYRNSFIDMELGGSAGLLLTAYDTYRRDAESNCYPLTGTRGLHLVPYPVVTDVRVAFVYRFVSVSGKYKESVYRRVQLKGFARQAINDSINKIRARIDSIDQSVRKAGFSGPDSLLNKNELKLWKQMQQERKEQAEKEALQKLRKQMADSLGIQYSDTLSAADEKALARAMKEREQQLKKGSQAQEKETDVDKETKKGRKRLGKKKEEEASADENAGGEAVESPKQSEPQTATEQSEPQTAAGSGKEEEKKAKGKKEKKEKKSRKSPKESKDDEKAIVIEEGKEGES